jgi:hypothetical protein
MDYAIHTIQRKQNQVGPEQAMVEGNAGSSLHIVLQPLFLATE